MTNVIISLEEYEELKDIKDNFDKKIANKIEGLKINLTNTTKFFFCAIGAAVGMTVLSFILITTGLCH